MPAAPAFSQHSSILVVGLGNPGARYADTRHNIGYRVVQELAETTAFQAVPFSLHKRTGAFVAEIPAGALGAGAPKLILARTATPMNTSGGVVNALANYFRIAPTGVIAVYDDMERDFGAFTLKHGSGDKGHNGLKSITKALGTKDYARLSIGIGRPPGKMDASSFVLGKFSSAQEHELDFVIPDAADYLRRELL
ncbi:aminoacyl-tRNA hydrolase [Corynebacterium propinquum]